MHPTLFIASVPNLFFQAHKYGRKADSLTVAGRIDEAIHYHNQAAGTCLFIHYK